MIVSTGNTITLKDSELPLDSFVIATHTMSMTNSSDTSVSVVVQIGFFLNKEKLYESPTNALKVVGFDKKDHTLKFNYPITVLSDNYVILPYDMDIIMKNHIMELFPEWDESKLVITTEPVIVE